MKERTLVLSLDYELFFHASGSIERCLFEPTGALLEFAARHDLKLTFYIDAGMLDAMRRHRDRSSIERGYDEIRRNVRHIHDAGHEIGLHVHPHWEDSRLEKGCWDFSGSRYQPSMFSTDEVSGVFDRYSNELNDITDGAVRSYRAGGFCIEPFSHITPHLARNGIRIDSSVVPGAFLDDVEKGFDFRNAPSPGVWRFSDTPLRFDTDGDFTEVAISPLSLPFFHYWGRLFDRLLGRKPPGTFGDGTSKKLGTREVLRRLAGAGRVSELSMDSAKAASLTGSRAVEELQLLHIMGHPKLIGDASLNALFSVLEKVGKYRSLTVSEVTDTL